MLLSLVLSLIFFSGCQKQEEACPVQTDLGFIELAPASFSFVPYDMNETLIYRNEEGEELRFSHFLTIQQDRFTQLVGNLRCRANSEETSEVRIDGGMVERWFTAPNGLQIRYSLQVSFLLFPPPLTVAEASEWKDFYDVFNCQVFRYSNDMQEVNETCSFSVVADYREGPPLRESYEWMNDHQYFPEVTVGGQTFQEVYAPSECAFYSDLYYTKEQGVVSFRDTDGQLWLLDRVE